MSPSGRANRYNADGYLVAANVVRGGLRSYLQVFRDGSLEYGDSCLLDSHGRSHIASRVLEERLLQTFKSAVELLRKLKVSTPIFVSLSLLQMKGRTMALPVSLQKSRLSYQSDEFDREVILTPAVLLEGDLEAVDVSASMMPLVDAIWQAAGLESAPNKVDDGRWLFT